MSDEETTITKKELKKIKKKWKKEVKKEIKQQNKTQKPKKQEKITRRKFLKKLGIGTASIGALSLLPTSALNIKDKNLKIFTTNNGKTALKQNLTVEKNGDINLHNNNLKNTKTIQGIQKINNTNISKLTDPSISQNGTTINQNPESLDFGESFLLNEQEDQTVRIEIDTPPIPVIKVTTDNNSRDINSNTRFPWNKLEFSDSEYFQFDNENHEITVNKEGTYELQSLIAADGNGGDRNNPVSQLYVNGEKQNAVGKSGYERHASGHHESSTHISWIGKLSEGDTITVEMRSEGDGGSPRPQANECNMYIKKIPRL